jgi:hypothetical protein
MYVNNIKVLMPNLFVHNPYLEIIWFRPNPIEHIDPQVFSSLLYLRILLLGHCVGGLNFGDAHGRGNVLSLIKRIENGECTSRMYQN